MEHCLQAHAERREGRDDALAQQASLGSLLQRLLILHSTKLMALAVFFAAMQLPGAIVWLLTGDPCRDMLLQSM